MGWPIKIYLCGQKTDKINILLATNIRVIRTMAALDVIITLLPRVLVKSTWGNLIYEAITWLCCVVEKMPEHYIEPIHRNF